MDLKNFAIILASMALCLIVTIGAVEEKKNPTVDLIKSNSTKVDKQFVVKKKLQQAKTIEGLAKTRTARDVSGSITGTLNDGDHIAKSPLSKRKSTGDLITAAHEKKYILVKKKPKHKKIKMEVFKPKMKYKKIKMKIPVKKMKKKKVKGYLVKKEHHHHEY